MSQSDSNEHRQWDVGMEKLLQIRQMLPHLVRWGRHKGSFQKVQITMLLQCIATSEILRARAVYDAGYDGWVLWSPGSVYEPFLAALEKKEVSRKKPFVVTTKTK